MSKITKTDDSNMADLIWWLRGFIVANKLNDVTMTDLCEDHVQTLRKYRLAHQDEIKESGL